MRSKETGSWIAKLNLLEKLIEHWEIYYAETGMVQGLPYFHV